MDRREDAFHLSTSLTRKRDHEIGTKHSTVLTDNTSVHRQESDVLYFEVIHEIHIDDVLFCSSNTVVVSIPYAKTRDGR